jgi:hypothetical protein
MTTIAPPDFHPKPYKTTTIRDDAGGDGLVDLVEREFVPDGPTLVHRHYLLCAARGYVQFGRRPALTGGDCLSCDCT